jgi:hypothetical protein
MMACEDGLIPMMSLDDEQTVSKNTAMFQIISKEGTTYNVPKTFLRMSRLIRTMVEGDKDADSLTLPDIGDDVLPLIIAYCTHYEGVEQEVIPLNPLFGPNIDRVVLNEWDGPFISNIKGPKREKGPGYENERLLPIFLMAVNYLDIPSLVYLGCVEIATWMYNLDHDAQDAIYLRIGAKNEEQVDAERIVREEKQKKEEEEAKAEEEKDNEKDENNNKRKAM